MDFSIMHEDEFVHPFTVLACRHSFCKRLDMHLLMHTTYIIQLHLKLAVLCFDSQVPTHAHRVNYALQSGRSRSWISV